MNPLIALVTLLTVVLMVATTFLVGRARGKYGIHAPATTGHEGFERAFRVQMKTQEAAIMFLPTLWLAAGFANPYYAALAGAAWLVGRVWYAIAYQNDPAKRGIGFGLGILAFLGLWFGALWGVVRLLMH